MGKVLLLGLATCLPTSALAQLLLPEDLVRGVLEVNTDAVGFRLEDIIRVGILELGGFYSVEVHLSSRLDVEVEALTRDKRGRQLRVSLCGRRVFETRLQEEMETATITVTTSDKEAAREIAKQFRRPPCAPQS